MFFRIFLCSVLLFVTACTKDKGAKSLKNRVSVTGPIPYVYEKGSEPKQAAMVKTTPVSWEQLLSQDVAIQELQSRYDQSRLVFAYAWAKSLAEKKGSAVTLSYFGETQEKLDETLNKNSVEPSESVEVTYSQEPGPEGVIAQAGGESLTWDDYISANMSHSKLYRSLFNQRINRLNGIVIRRHLLEAAKSQNMAMEEYVQKNILTTQFQATEGDVKKFAQEKGIAESDIDEKMMERLKDIVKQNNRDSRISEYVAKNLIKEPIKIYFPPTSLKISSPKLDVEVPKWGAKGPELVYIGHWDCEDCSSLLQTFLKAKNQGSQIMQGSFIYSFPKQDRESRMGAEAALCVHSIDEKSYWVFLDKVLGINEANIETRINTAVEAAGVDAEQFKDCFLKRKFQDAVESHLSYADSMGMTRSPLLVVQGQVIEPPFDVDAVSQRLQTLKKKLAPPSLWQKIRSFFGL